MSFLFVVLLLGAGGLFLARLLDTLGAGRAHSPIPQVAAFAPCAVPVWALLVVLGVAAGPGVLVLVPAAALVVQVIWAVPGRRRGARLGDEADAGQLLTLVTVNALLGRADREAVLDLVRKTGADVLVVQELTPQLAADLDPPVRGAGLAAADLYPGHAGSGTGIWSRWPLAVLGLLPSSRCAIPQVRVQPPVGGPVTITGVHTQAPNPRRLYAWRADLAMLAGTVRASSGPQVLAGDFNASRDHAGFRQLLAAGVADAADIANGWAPGFTWPAHLQPFSERRWLALTRLDHVLVSPGIEVRSVRTVSVSGTDHKAVVAVLQLPLPMRH